MTTEQGGGQNLKNLRIKLILQKCTHPENRRLLTPSPLTPNPLHLLVLRPPLFFFTEDVGGPSTSRSMGVGAQYEYVDFG